MVDLNDVLAKFQGTEIEAQQDVENVIVALEGKYLAEIKKFELVEMGDGSFFSMNLCITETVSGVKGDGRYVGKNFSNGDTQYASAEENMEKLLKALVTMGIPIGATLAELANNCKQAEGKIVSVKLRPQRDGKEVKTDKNGWPKHFVTIVEKFDMVDPIGSAKTSKTPF